MQYTGLNDKHGKEIYEGDIVKDDEKDVGAVEYNEGSFIVFYEPMSEYQWRNYEIIGNIYENKELLKD